MSGFWSPKCGSWASSQKIPCFIGFLLDILRVLPVVVLTCFALPPLGKGLFALAGKPIRWCRIFIRCPPKFPRQAEGYSDPLAFRGWTRIDPNQSPYATVRANNSRQDCVSEIRAGNAAACGARLPLSGRARPGRNGGVLRHRDDCHRLAHPALVCSGCGSRRVNFVVTGNRTAIGCLSSRLPTVGRQHALTALTGCA